MTRLAHITREYRDAGATSDLIPLYGFVDDGVFLTKSGALGIVLALDGVDYECLDPQLLRIVLRSATARPRYDPAKVSYVTVTRDGRP